MSGAPIDPGGGGGGGGVSPPFRPDHNSASSSNNNQQHTSAGGGGVAMTDMKHSSPLLIPSGAVVMGGPTADRELTSLLSAAGSATPTQQSTTATTITAVPPQAVIRSLPNKMDDSKHSRNRPRRQPSGTVNPTGAGTGNPMLLPGTAVPTSSGPTTAANSPMAVPSASSLSSADLKQTILQLVDDAYAKVKRERLAKQTAHHNNNPPAEHELWKAACAAVYLHLAATGRVALLKELISYYTQPSIGSLELGVRDAYGSTALILAAQNGQLETVKYLLSLTTSAGGGPTPAKPILDVDAQNKSGMTALICAAKSDHHLPLVQYLCTVARANVSLTNQWGDTALLFASKMGNGTIVEWLIHNTRADLHAVDSQGDSALVSIIREGHGPFLQMAQFLLAQGAVLPGAVVLSLAANPKWTPERLYELCLQAVKYSTTPILE